MTLPPKQLQEVRALRKQCAKYETEFEGRVFLASFTLTLAALIAFDVAVWLALLIGLIVAFTLYVKTTDFSSRQANETKRTLESTGLAETLFNEGYQQTILDHLRGQKHETTSLPTNLREELLFAAKHWPEFKALALRDTVLHSGKSSLLPLETLGQRARCRGICQYFIHQLKQP